MLICRQNDTHQMKHVGKMRVVELRCRQRRTTVSFFKIGWCPLASCMQWLYILLLLPYLACTAETMRFGISHSSSSSAMQQASSLFHITLSNQFEDLKANMMRRASYLHKKVSRQLELATVLPKPQVMTAYNNSFDCCSINRKNWSCWSPRKRLANRAQSPSRENPLGRELKCSCSESFHS